eukprot:15773-Heterococcus_DN1.PRE.2
MELSARSHGLPMHTPALAQLSLHYKASRSAGASVTAVHVVRICLQCPSHPFMRSPLYLPLHCLYTPDCTGSLLEAGFTVKCKACAASCPAGINGYRCEVLPAGYVAPAMVTAAVTAPAPVPVVVTPVVVAVTTAVAAAARPGCAQQHNAHTVHVCNLRISCCCCVPHHCVTTESLLKAGFTAKAALSGTQATVARTLQVTARSVTVLLCFNGAVGAVGAAPAAPDAPVSNLPQTVVDGQFEAGNANTAWQQNCAMYSEKVTVGGQ